MSDYLAIVMWERRGAPFVDSRYSRAHTWEFDGGAVVPASSSPHVVPAPLSDPHAVDPEEAFVAALASCHMLWFLSIAARRKHCVQSYRDRAIGTMTNDTNGRLAITSVALRPHTIFSPGEMITDEVVYAMHQEAHAKCFIANSVKTRLEVVPTFEVTAGHGR